MPHLNADVFARTSTRLKRLERLERDEIVRCLTQPGVTMGEVANTLGLSRATLYRKVNHYRITLPGRTMQAPSAVFEAWRREFDVLYREDRYFCLAMHPQIIGRPSRITLLEELIQYILGHPRVWLARCDEVAARHLTPDCARWLKTGSLPS